MIDLSQYDDDNTPSRINHKILQFFGGNWGHPRKIKKSTEIKPFRTHTHSKNKRKKFKHVDPLSICPFCKSTLEEDKEKKVRWRWRKIYVQACKECKAKMVENSCPCCQKDAWFLNFIYTHQKSFFGCGFTGERNRQALDRIY